MSITCIHLLLHPQGPLLDSQKNRKGASVLVGSTGQERCVILGSDRRVEVPLKLRQRSQLGFGVRGLDDDFNFYDDLMNLPGY